MTKFRLEAVFLKCRKLSVNIIKRGLLEGTKAFNNLQLHLACRYIKMCVLSRHIICGEDTTIQIWMVLNNVWKYPRKKLNKVKRCFIICSHIWHVDLSKCGYWLNIHFGKVWRRNVLTNANAVNFCDISF